MTTKNYNGLALAIFGEKAFADLDSPIADMEGFAADAEEALDELGEMNPAYRAAVEAVCLEGKEITEEIRNNYGKGMRFLRHPSHSAKFRAYLNKRDELE